MSWTRALQKVSGSDDPAFVLLSATCKQTDIVIMNEGCRVRHNLYVILKYIGKVVDTTPF